MQTSFIKIGIKNAGSAARSAAEKAKKAESAIQKSLEGRIVKESRLLNAHLLPQAQKDFFESEGIPYLMPNEVWSTEKILQTTKQIRKPLDELIKSNNLNKETLQALINKLVPEAEGSIAIKDFSDLRNYLKDMGCPEEQIELYLKVGGLASWSTNGSANVFFKFEQLKTKDVFDKIVLKDAIEHEPEHALRNRFQNTSRINVYKNSALKDAIEEPHNIFNFMFSKFESDYWKNFQF